VGNIEKFDLIASQYDTPERIENANIVLNTLHGYMRGAKDKTALDYGCGTGLIGLRLLGDFRSVLLVDASANMVAEVERKISGIGAHNATALCCNLMEDTPPALSADYIIVVMVLLHEKDTKTLLARLASVLNPGGHLIIVDFDKNDRIDSDLVHHGFDRQELSGTLRELSFDNVTSEIFHRGERIFMNQDASMFILNAVKL
jgi:ubiquinone/menaquinone biosynthesis C-methylase UbiE